MVLAGCGSGTEPEPVTLASAYSFSIDIADSRADITCDVDGTVAITQQETAFTGLANDIAACRGLGVDFTQEETGQLIEGEIRGRSIKLEFDILNAPCTGSGRADGDPVQSMSGTARCTFFIDRQFYWLDGTWEAQVLIN